MLALEHINLSGFIIILLVFKSRTDVERKSGSLHPIWNALCLLVANFAKLMELKCSTKMSIAFYTACKNILSPDLRDFQHSIIEWSCSDH